MLVTTEPPGPPSDSEEPHPCPEPEPEPQPPEVAAPHSALLGRAGLKGVRSLFQKQKQKPFF